MKTFDRCSWPIPYVSSEFAGCASSFKGAMLVNPYDPDNVAESIHSALKMSVSFREAYRQGRMHDVHLFCCG